MFYKGNILEFSRKTEHTHTHTHTHHGEGGDILKNLFM